MAISRKGSRKITVDNIEYFFKVSKIKGISNCRVQDNELDAEFINQASIYGLSKS
tara:strand:+ start:328 stop:492 length:165 start_codon:yes stop_codon:yes gene_type:complete